MSALWQTPAVVVMILSWLASPPAGLGEVAQREALRRAATAKATATLTNFGQSADEPPPAAVTLPATEAPPTVTPPAGETPPPPTEPASAAAAEPPPVEAVVAPDPDRPQVEMAGQD